MGIGHRANFVNTSSRAFTSALWHAKQV